MKTISSDGFINGLGANDDYFSSARLHSLGAAALVGYATYLIYKASKRGTRKRKKPKTRSKQMKKMSSRAFRMARATTVPMRFFRTHTDRNRLGLKAEDWVSEQKKLMVINRKKKGRKHATRSYE